MAETRKFLLVSSKPDRNPVGKLRRELAKMADFHQAKIFLSNITLGLIFQR